MIRTLFREDQIQRRIEEIAQEIQDYYQGKPLTVVVLLNGGIFFAADLVRKIQLPMQLDSFAASSYKNDVSSGKLDIRSQLKLNIKDRYVLIVDDILDTGFTLQQIKNHFDSLGAAEVRSCVLLNKILKDGKQKMASTEWSCFDTPDLYVVGYGLDSQELYRNLPYIGYIPTEDAE